jgi:predicted Zn-dependent protease
LERDDEAVRHADRALELDPNSLIIRSDRTWVYSWARQYDKAVSLAKESRALYPRTHVFSQVLMLIYRTQGMDTEAAAEVRKLLEIATAQPPNFVFQAQCFAVLGEKSKSLAALDNLLKQGWGTEDPCFIPWIYAVLGDKDRAFESLEKQLELRHPNWVQVKLYLGTTSLRGDPRFSALIRKIGLEK